MEFESRIARFSSMLNGKESSRIGSRAGLAVGSEVGDTQKRYLFVLPVTLLQRHQGAFEVASVEDLAVVIAGIVEIAEDSVVVVAVLEALVEEEALDTEEAIDLEAAEVALATVLPHPMHLLDPVVAVVVLVGDQGLFLLVE